MKKNDDTNDIAAIDINHDLSDALLLDLEGFEGPIDLLLTLAQRQKVDLRRISVLKLAQQYLSYIDQARSLKLDIAAEYLVMATWLAYLKSRLLLPADDTVDENMPSGDEMAAALAFQLRRLEAMKECAETLLKRPRMGMDIFPRGHRIDTESLGTETEIRHQASLFDLIQAYGEVQQRHAPEGYSLPPMSLMSMEVAFDRFEAMLGALPRNGRYSTWTTLNSFFPKNTRNSLYTRSAMASLFTVGLEMAKQGDIDIRQDSLFAPIYIRQIIPIQ